MSSIRGLAADFRYAFRTHWKRPAFACVATLVLVLGVATATLMFSLVDALLLRPLPVENPERLVRLYTSSTAGLRFFTLSYPDYQDVAALGEVFTGVAADEPLAVAVLIGGVNQRRYAYRVTPNYFQVLGVRPKVGRFFSSSDETDVVVLGAGLWRRAFGGRASVVGERLSLNGAAFTVIGVAPEAFRGTHTGLRPELWIPLDARGLGFEGRERNRAQRGFFVVGRLRDGVTVDDARARVSVLAEQLQTAYPESNQGVTFPVLPESLGRVHPLARDHAVGLSGAAALVVVVLLVLICANVSGLLLSRGVGRRREICLRMAIGAGRFRMARQLLVETLLLAGLASALGLAVTWPMTALVSTLELPTERPISLDLSVDHRVLLFSLVVAGLSTLGAGLLPALQASRQNLMEVIRASGSTYTGSLWRTRRILIGGQVALSVLLLVTTGWFMKSLANARNMDVGFEPEGLAVASVDLSLHRYDASRAESFFRAVTDRLSAHAAMDSVALTSSVPLSLNIVRTSVTPVESTRSDADTRLTVDVASVDDGYFRTMGIPMLVGRGFAEGEADRRSAVVVNETLASKLWPGGPALGKRLLFRDGSPREIIGIVETGKYLSIGEEPTPFLYLPWDPSRALAATIVTRTDGLVSPTAATRILSSEIRSVGRNVVVYDAKTMDEHLSLALLPARASAFVAAFFGLAALVLVAVGLYGALAQGVTERAREIGIRRALGAGIPDVLGLVLRQGMTTVAGGLALGVPAAAAVSGLSRSSLYGVTTSEPKAWAWTILVLLGSAALASVLPAYRAARLAPADVLRYE